MLKHGRYYWCRLPTCKKSLWTFWNKKYWGVSWFVCSKGYINVSWCIWELLKYVLKYMNYNQLQKSLPRSLQKIWNYKQPLKTVPTNQCWESDFENWCNTDATLKFSSHDINKFILLLQKAVYPYEYIDD